MKNKVILGAGISGLLLISLCVLGMFAWGVSNAGTAMRHREKFIPINIVMFCISLNYIKTKIKVTLEHTSI